MKLNFFIVDAFVDSSKPFTGNPAIVVPLENDELIDDVLKQKIANEFGVSETAFVSKHWRDQPNDCDDFLIRWFTPQTEVILCGHATLATSYVLFNGLSMWNVSRDKPLRFQTRFDSELQTTVQDQHIVLNFPLNDCSSIDATWINSIKEAVVHKNVDHIIDVQYSSGAKKLLFRLKDSDSILDIKPDFQKLGKIDTNDVVRGLIVTQKGDINAEGVHFKSRYFAPWVGINEDPVTGSAHTVLTPYWSRIYGDNNETFHAKQMSNRVGVLECKIVQPNRVTIKGKARVFCQGTIDI